MFKIMKKEVPNHLINLIPKCKAAIRTRNNNFTTYNCRMDCFKYSFFPSTLYDWFRLDVNIRNSESISLFKSTLLSFICPSQCNKYNIFEPIGLKLLTRLRLGLEPILMNTNFVIIFKTVQILYVLAVWKLKILRTTLRTVNTFQTIATILRIV